MAAVSERQIHRAFEISIALKGLFAILECAAGVALYFTSRETMVAVVTALVHNELVEHPRDFVATYVLGLAEGFSVSGRHFAIWYLISHGAVKVVLVAGLLRNLRWAYPASLVVLGLFILYQLYRMTFAPSPGLVLLTVFDLFVIALIWHEWGLIQRHLPQD
jgi:uncharacterized membrane protein